MAQVVEPDGADLAHREELEVALRAAPRVGVGGRLLVPAPLAPALVDVPRDDAGPAHRPPEHELKLRRLPEHLAVRSREDEIRGRRRDRPVQIDHQLAVDRDRLGAVPFRGVPVVRVADRDQPGDEVDIRLPQPEQLALTHAGVDRGRE